MKKVLFVAPVVVFFAIKAQAQDIKTKDVPEIVKQALAKKYPKTSKVTWEKEKGNYEANWGGKSGEETSVQFTPAGAFVEEVNAINVSQLPANVAPYVKSHYNGARIKEAGKVTDAAGKHFFEAEIKGEDLIFDQSGNFVKVD
ncbi:PepSY-like domain-containing protein [Mucilaginibacter sp. BT774]|uniref:PepSY-like domain-containing protein n=1 Tax=Mucilaginibacter sp. BT774 TaxID=3062276 RepID=UPI0026768DDD|nr:PepSY-like domain-containing protein [Mucilaginibacter sp. BT774]MDO3624598.1 PepSY-like domain-containing protein [Mucilaginibacter sp. BT774]